MKMNRVRAGRYTQTQTHQQFIIRNMLECDVTACCIMVCVILYNITYIICYDMLCYDMYDIIEYNIH